MLLGDTLIKAVSTSLRGKSHIQRLAHNTKVIAEATS